MLDYPEAAYIFYLEKFSNIEVYFVSTALAGFKLWLERGCDDTSVKPFQLLGILVLNSVIIPVVAVFVVDISCFYNIISASPPIITTYTTQECHQNCYTLEYPTEFFPPFIYSYQCGMTVLQNYVPVYIMTYLISGIILPSHRLFIAVYCKDLYQKGDCRSNTGRNENTYNSYIYILIQWLRNHARRVLMNSVLNKMSLPINPADYVGDVATNSIGMTEMDDLGEEGVISPISPISRSLEVESTSQELQTKSSLTIGAVMTITTPTPSSTRKASISPRRIKLYGLRTHFLMLAHWHC